MNKILLWLFTLIALGHAAIAADAALEDTLKKQYLNQVLTLRTPFQEDKQEFDSHGTPLKEPPTGKWIARGSMKIEKLSLTADTLVLQGTQMAMGEDTKTHAQVPSAMERFLVVEIHLDRPLNSVSEARALLERIYGLEQHDPKDALPQYKRPPQSVYPGDAAETDNVPVPSGQGISRPQVKYAPNPDFSERARKAKYQGAVYLNIIVDKDGRVSWIRVDKAAGMGLDEQAVETVKTWRFVPATQNGKPVPVQLGIWVGFNLF